MDNCFFQKILANLYHTPRVVRVYVCMRACACTVHVLVSMCANIRTNAKWLEEDLSKY